MGDPTGFMKFTRAETTKSAIEERVLNYSEFERAQSGDSLKQQGARCMDCGIPFCHGPTGCPLGNLIPVWNDHVFRDQWREAIEALHATNNFPEFTGRVCPAPCETACVLGINEPPVTIKQIEVSIVDRAFAEGWIKPVTPEKRTGKKVAVIGSGPAGLACAQQLNRAGHLVTVFERADRPGGLLMYGIPDFKMEKRHVQRRVELMKEEGIAFEVNANIGVNVEVKKLRDEFDAIVLCGGSTKPRDLEIPGRELAGVHFAMEFLPQQNKRNQGDTLPSEKDILAKGKNVIVIGGGDTGSDCIGTSIRQGAKKVTQLEVMPEPPGGRTKDFPWPYWPMIKRTSSSQAESTKVVNGDLHYAILTKEFIGEGGKLKQIRTVDLKWTKQPDGRMVMEEVPNSDRFIDAELVLLAMGFLHPEHSPMLKDLGVELDGRGNVKTKDAATKATTVEGVFAAGDMRRGQSLVVWAIAEGRDAAYDCDEWLMGQSQLPRSTPR